MCGVMNEHHVSPLLQGLYIPKQSKELMPLDDLHCFLMSLICCYLHRICAKIWQLKSHPRKKEYIEKQMNTLMNIRVMRNMYFETMEVDCMK